MVWRIIFRTIVFSLLAVGQLSFAAGLPYGFREINFLLIFMVFFLEVNSGLSTAWWFVFVGFIFGLYNSFLFPLYLVLWPATFLLCRFLYSNVMTNRSLYSFLGLISLTTIFHYITFNAAVYAAHVFFREEAGLFLIERGFYSSLLLAVAINALAVTVVFYFVNQVTDRLKPVFIFKR